ncbi:T9SS type A sorting domain-containing protein [Microvirga sp. STR05]|uniref:T9SS type A sorting domain-containing protein n=1 Tax=Hymenobacter duratus TaxID=2771356 RepID=A0ABR8JLP9_9BACT|nr:M43 family zinc metalloprotease [Hymenobacter duratus]MBD2716651.1 T9SS type A sorting domain-containing protein [Hymenobacter duratus]MBR7951566.1 T9SS type A sorting domain-containing protein [Microvirga sp. STR05]
MQIKRLPNLLLLLAVLLTQFSASAQQLRTRYPEQYYGFRCASDSMQQLEWRRNPAAEQEYRAFIKGVAMMSAEDQARILATPDVTVPVVVHVIHQGGASNISDAQVDDAIRILNEDYSKTNRDTADVIAAFQPLYANVGFRFRLAKLDPDGNCTTGITRTYSSLTASAGNNVKDLIRWDPNRYLNIWVVDNIASGAGGYAYLPCPGTGIDGIVIRNTQFASIGRSCGSNFCNRSLTHEVGHYFGLPHTWGGTNTPGDPANCGLDDGIADTPNTSGVTSGCPSTTYRPCNPNSTTGSTTPNNNPNGILANVQNYMDYATCAKMFTTGQKMVMRASLTRLCRNTLVSAQNLLETGTSDGFQAAPCAPVAAFQSSATSVCEGSSLTFTDYTYNFTYNAATTQYDWRFPGGTPATSSARNPTVTYPTGGSYDVTLIVITPNGRDTLTRTQLVQVQGVNSGERAPLVESFENQNFPQNYANAPIRNWRVLSNQPGDQPLSWQRVAGVASNGAAYLMAPNNFLTDGTESILISPNINLSSISSTPTLVFDRAYARRSTTINDVLRVSFSIDCGVTWSSPLTYSAAALNTKGSVTQVGFSPTSVTDWQPITVPLSSAYQGSQRFLVRFVAISNAGNPIYIDNVRILDPLGTQDAEMARRGISVYPNPLTAETAVHFTLPTAERAAVRLTDMLGRDVTSIAGKTYGAGTHAIRLQGADGKTLTAGVYLVHLTLGQQTFTTKVLVN